MYAYFLEYVAELQPLAFVMENVREIGKFAGRNARLDEYAEVSRRVAKATGARLCDLRKSFQGYLAEHNAEDKDKGVLTTDRVHLSDELGTR